jgi:hypothetical protein
MELSTSFWVSHLPILREHNSCTGRGFNVKVCNGYRVGDLRFRLPVNISSYNQSFDATQYGLTCVAQNSTASSNLVKTAGKIIGYIFGDDDEPKTPQSEDCECESIVHLAFVQPLARSYS